jgi:hypothetical protein
MAVTSQQETRTVPVPRRKHNRFMVVSSQQRTGAVPVPWPVWNNRLADLTPQTNLTPQTESRQNLRNAKCRHSGCEAHSTWAKGRRRAFLSIYRWDANTGAVQFAIQARGQG